MKLATLAVFTALIATPALAASDYPDAQPSQYPDEQSTVPSPDLDSQTATKDAARQNYYQDKLNAAKAQTQADNAQAQADQAQADRDAALNRADQDREDARAADQ